MTRAHSALLFMDPRAWTWARSHIEQMQCGEEHVVEPPILQCARAVPLCPDSMYLHGLFALAELLIRLPRPAHLWCLRDVHIRVVAPRCRSVWPECGTCCYPCASIVFISASCRVASHDCSDGAQTPGTLHSDSSRRLDHFAQASHSVPCHIAKRSPA